MSRHRSLTFDNCSVVDPGSGQVRSGRTLHIADGVIREETDVRVESDRIDFLDIDGSGLYALPGFIDMHVHVTWGEEAGDGPGDLALKAAANLRKALLAGTTTVRDVGSPHGAGLAARRATARGDLGGARVFSSNLQLCATGGHGSEYAGYGRVVSGTDDCRQAVREQLEAGADLIKVIANGVRGFPELTLAELGAVVDEAHRSGVKVACHANVSAAAVLAVAAGIDTLEHGCDLDLATAQAMADKGIILVPTYEVFRIWQRLADSGEATVPYPPPYRRHRESISHAVSVGVRIATGTDYGQWAGPFESLVDEMNALAEIDGISNWDVLAAATVNGADALGRFDLGRISVGATADLVLLRSDPLSSLDALTDIAYVVKGGQIVYSAVTPDQAIS